MMAIKKITDDGALRLLEAIMSSSAEDFRGGITQFVDASIEEEKAKQSLERTIKRLYKAQKDKMDALSIINEEFKFLKGEKKISPTVDGGYILANLMKDCLREMNAHTRNYAMGLEGKRNGKKGKEKE